MCLFNLAVLAQHSGDEGFGRCSQIGGIRYREYNKISDVTAPNMQHAKTERVQRPFRNNITMIYSFRPYLFQPTIPILVYVTRVTSHATKSGT